MISVPERQAIILTLSELRGMKPAMFTRHMLSKDGKHVILPLTLQTCAVLAAHGHMPQGPIRHEYNFPIKAGLTPMAHQITTSDFFTQNQRSFCFNEIGCVDAETEFLTPLGWKRIDEYVEGDLVAQFDKDTEEMEFVEPEGYIKLPCDEFYHIKTKYGLDQMLSGEHRVIYKGSTNKWAVRPMREVAERHWANAGGFSGRLPVTYNFKPAGGLPYTDAELRLMTAYIADGHFPNKTSRCTVRLKKKRKIERLHLLLRKAGIDYKHRVCAAVKGFEVFAFNTPLRIKEFDARFWQANNQQLNIIAEEAPLWDGCIRKAGAVEFCSTSKLSADFIQHCFIVSGRVSSMSRTLPDKQRNKVLYSVHARNNANPLYIMGSSAGQPNRKDNITKVQTPGAWKYCFAVPSTCLVLRRNNRVFITGNTCKTLSALWAADYLKWKGRMGKVLIVSPLSTLLRVWGDEIFCNFPGKTFAILHGSRARRLKLLAEDHDYYIINPDGLKVLADELKSRRDITHVIVDEGAIFRNSKTDLYDEITSVAGVKSGRTVWWMTGSPMPNAPTDIWAQARVINPNLVPRYFSRFRDKVMFKVTQFQWAPRKGWQNTVYSMLKPSVRFKRDECLDLPPCIVEDRQVEMTSEQSKAYKTMVNDLVVEMKNGKITAANEGVLLGKLLQIAGGAVYDQEGNTHELDYSIKLHELVESIEFAGNKAIVFSDYKHLGRRIAKDLAKKFSVAQINGDVGVAKRNKIFHDFQAGDLQVIVAHPQCMSHGLTLTASHTIIWTTPTQSHEYYEQANGRITRPGQTVKQTILHLYTSEAERKTYKRLQGKANMQGLLMDLLTTTA